MGLLKIFDHEYKEIKKFNKIAKEIDDLNTEYQKLSDEGLRNKTTEFKSRLKKGETIEDILVEAFATAREACFRVTGLKPYYVQLLGGLALHYGNISEMKTGEGKTLVSVLPAYLNALTGEGVHIITVNEYLSSRDASWMGPVHIFLGLTVGSNIREMTPAEKREQYNCDITYTTNNELGFDYLRDNMAIKKEDRVQRGLNYAIIDEVDSVLIDEARTPLIISGGFLENKNLYIDADRFVKGLKLDESFTYDEKIKRVNLTEEGVKKAESWFRVNNLYDIDNTTIVHFINQALHANYSMNNDVDYVVQDGKILIVDQFTGRLMHGRQFSEGLHQAIEAKEGVEINQETKTLATITFQNLFRMYKKLSGMTGTAKTEEEEFRNIYNMYVISIPTNKPVIRNDFADTIYANKNGKFKAIVKEIKERHEKGQPILVGTIAIETSEYLSDLLKKEKIPHQVLNAKNHPIEGEIIARAGEKGSVTIATNMAGRGTDIKLGGNADFEIKKEMQKKGYSDEVIALVASPLKIEDKELLPAKKDYDEIASKIKEKIKVLEKEIIDLGGLCVIGTERHESRRIDNQLRGRSGRQGDPGFSRFFIAMDDELLVRFGAERLRTLLESIKMADDMQITSKMFSSSVQSAQKRVEGNNFDMRKSVLQYDDVMNNQREIIYKRRNIILDNDSIHQEVLDAMYNHIADTIDSHLNNQVSLTENDLKEILEYVNTNLIKTEIKINDIKDKSSQDLIKYIYDLVVDLYEDKIKEIPEEIRNEFEKVISLNVIDNYWMEQINTMSHLREGIDLRQYAQENPLRAYTEEGFQLFDNMLANIDKYITLYLLKAEIRQNIERKEVVKKKLTNDSDTTRISKIAKSNKVGRNDKCPCGSGKKYKQCCGK